MNITRYGHSCLLVEENGVRVLTDIGTMNEMPDAASISAIVISHDHADHFDISKIQEVLKTSPDAQVITHAAVGEKLKEAGINFVAIEPGESISVNGFTIESYGTDHAKIYGDMPQCRNTGFLLGGKLFMPGDAVHDVPPKPVEILALPTGGPWMKLSEAIDYAKAVKPKGAFPIHDALYNDQVRTGMLGSMFANFLSSDGIEFVNLQPGESREF